MAQRRIDLLAIEQNAWVLAACDDRCVVVETRTELDWAMKNGQTCVWAPSKIVLDSVDTPSAQPRDAVSLAAWFAATYQARELLVIGEALPSNPRLAFRWIEHVLSEDVTSSWQISEQLHTAVSVLTAKERTDLLDSLSPSYWYFDVVDILVGKDIEIYVALLQNQNLQRFHLVPLGHKPNPAWRTKTLAALRYSYPPEEIARATLGLQSGMGWSGKESSMWQEWIDAFEPYCNDPDLAVCAVAEAGKALAVSELTRALGEEHYQQVHGIHFP
jgi:hypothetical protein